MRSFGWITQEQIRGKSNVNNILTKKIKEYLVSCGYERFRDKEIRNRNCLYHKEKNQYVVVYTRHKKQTNENITWAPYEYVKKLAESGKYVILLLGILDGDILKGELYKVEGNDVSDMLDNLELTREEYYSIGENQIQKYKVGQFLRIGGLIECLRIVVGKGNESYGNEQF